MSSRTWASTSSGVLSLETSSSTDFGADVRPASTSLTITGTTLAPAGRRASARRRSSGAARYGRRRESKAKAKGLSSPTQDKDSGAASSQGTSQAEGGGKEID